MDPKEFPLSVTEWQLMSAVWDLKSADASAVAERMQSATGRDYSVKSISIMLSRLASKGLLRFDQVQASSPGRPAYVYSPALPRELALQRQFRRFLRDHSVHQQDFQILHAVLDAL